MLPRQQAVSPRWPAPKAGAPLFLIYGPMAHPRLLTAFPGSSAPGKAGKKLGGAGSVMSTRPANGALISLRVRAKHLPSSTLPTPILV